MTTSTRTSPSHLRYSLSQCYVSIVSPPPVLSFLWFVLFPYHCYDSFFFLCCSSLDSLSSLHTVPPECLPPKHSFLHIYTLCMVPLSCFYLPLMDVLLLTCIASTQPHSIYHTALLSPYIHLGSSTMNTAWSMNHILIYLNDDVSCTFLNLNLLESPSSPGSL